MLLQFPRRPPQLPPKVRDGSLQFSHKSYVMAAPWKGPKLQLLTAAAPRAGPVPPDWLPRTGPKPTEGNASTRRAC
eukprot:5011039-Lingulodinium_polyedra.AAC.2